MCFKKLILTAGVVVSLVSTASAISINDNFIGSGDFAGGGRDVIGSNDTFNITSANFTLSADRSFLTVTIFSNYFNNVGALGTAVGALFLDTANGKAHVNGSDGAKWNFGVTANNAGSANAGSSNVYGLTSQDSLLMSDSFNNGLWSAWRTNQEVDVNSTSANLVGTSSWEFLNKGTPSASLSFYVPVSLIGGASVLNSDISFSWGMTCANDIIRGSGSFKAVPEPASMLLLGCGAFGAIRRRARAAE